MIKDRRLEAGSRKPGTNEGRRLRSGPQHSNRFGFLDCLLPCFPVLSGADRDRTGDPLVANQVLSHLSYRPELVIY